MEAHISWERIAKIAAYWGGPFAIKGLQCADDALRAADAGATAVILSNHGGRQLDGGGATIDLVADIVDAVGERVEVILDGGVRRSEEHTSELQSLMRISYAVFCLKKKKTHITNNNI